MIESNKVVKLDYVVKDDLGKIIDSSEGRAPLVYLHGAGDIIPGLESALVGKDVGDSFIAKILPSEAYGARDESLLQQVDRTAFQGVDEIKEGMVFNAQTPDGEIQVTIVNVSDDFVTVDGNHPLAGVVMNFEGVVREVRDATKDEIEHGHAH